MAYGRVRSPLTLKQRVRLIAAQMEAERKSFEPHWREINDFLFPRRGRFTVQDANRGDRRSKNIIDSSASFAARTLSAGMMSGMTSPARPWFRLTTPDPDLGEYGPVKEWLHIVTQRMNTVFLRSNLYNVLPIIYNELGGFGTSAMAVLESQRSVIRCVPFPVGSYSLSLNAELEVDAFARKYRMTVRQLVEMFGLQEGSDNEIDWSKFSQNVKAQWDQRNFETWIDIQHLIVPNTEYDGIRLRSENKRYAQYYLEDGTGQDEVFLEKSGFDDFPVLAPRWEVTGEDIYGTNCPGMMALGDIKQLQLGEKRGMQAIDKMVSPPMVGPTSMRASKASILPGDITYVDTREGQQGFRPAYEVKPDVQQLEYKQERIRYRISRAFFEDLFLMLATNPNIEDTQKTAREIEERHEEKLLALGPVLEQMNQDLLDPLIDRTFSIMLRQELIPTPPEELEGDDLKVEYLSIMAQSQKMIGLSGMERFSAFVINNAAQLPDAAVMTDKVDFDQMIDEYADMTGIPPRIVRPDEAVAVMRQERAKAQQALEQAQALKDASQSAKNFSQSEPRGDNMLSDMMRGAMGSAHISAPEPTEIM
jgi:hypothetical protein